MATTGKIYIDSYGTEIRVNTGLDLTDASSHVFKVLKPNGQEVTWTATRESPDTEAITISVDAVFGTFTRSSGSFSTDGFNVGDTITTSGFTNAGNNTTKIVQSVTSLVIVVTSTTGLVTEIGNGNERIVSNSYTSGYLKYTTVSSDFNVAGNYKLYALVTFTGKSLPGEVAVFRVYGKWE
jgi:hypothetical protein